MWYSVAQRIETDNQWDTYASSRRSGISIVAGYPHLATRVILVDQYLFLW